MCKFLFLIKFISQRDQTYHKSRFQYLNRIYEEGKQRLQEDFSIEKLLVQMREIKVLLKTKKILNSEIRYDLQFKPQMVIDLDKSFKEEES